MMTAQRTIINTNNLIAMTTTSCQNSTDETINKVQHYDPMPLFRLWDPAIQLLGGQSPFFPHYIKNLGLALRDSQAKQWLLNRLVVESNTLIK